jgi:Gas vesicle synthesis protein GvpL/GvpF
MSTASNTSHFLVHAVMKADAHPQLMGNHVVANAPLSFVEQSGLMALVSEISSAVDADSIFADAETSAKIAVAHHALLTSLSAHMDLAPIRLGAVYVGTEAVKSMLKASALDFSQALEMVAGAAEFAMKLTPVEGFVQTPASAPVVNGRAYLQRRSIAAAEQRTEVERARSAASEIFTSVSNTTRAHVFSSPRRNATADSEKRLLDAALLVSRDKIEAFGKTVLMAQERAFAQGFHLSVTGPLPPYSFVGVAERSGALAGALA